MGTPSLRRLSVTRLLAGEGFTVGAASKGGAGVAE